MKKEPIIIAFCCNWCSYAAADLAGISRLQYPGSIRIIRVMCSGMVHPDLVLQALNKGADGVIVVGCHLGECHYLKGNEMALARAEIIADTLEDLGIAAERFQLVWVSSSEPERLVAAFRAMSERLRAGRTPEIEAKEAGQ
ncbi:MAG: hydrogenase iron-sulfur subunit [Desulfobulbus sp.]|jgi:F420-non-reducing hydrogenase iron-sulfur subunit|uniref:hydrogenase iron-sulfur subunit n=1 Tax=Desulfobulbus sp. TaxID=895 RepID=UPI0028518A08|nr:hydrogenase iron-sulfur subunit [Desulfobulbus sp.]MDR2549131.1 hydrogenase iron-sulfur subunit [Desulfobulbus sp.]